MKKMPDAAPPTVRHLLATLASVHGEFSRSLRRVECLLYKTHLPAYDRDIARLCPNCGCW